MPEVTPGYMEGSLGSTAVDWDARLDMGRLRATRTKRAQDAVTAAGYDAGLVLADPNIRYVTSVATGSVSGAGGLPYSPPDAYGALTHCDSADHAVVHRPPCPGVPDLPEP